MSPNTLRYCRHMSGVPVTIYRFFKVEVLLCMFSNFSKNKMTSQQSRKGNSRVNRAVLSVDAVVTLWIITLHTKHIIGISKYNNHIYNKMSTFHFYTSRCHFCTL